MKEYYYKVNGVEIDPSELDWEAATVVVNQISETLQKLLDLVEKEKAEKPAIQH